MPLFFSLKLMETDPGIGNAWSVAVLQSLAPTQINHIWTS